MDVHQRTYTISTDPCSVDLQIRPLWGTLLGPLGLIETVIRLHVYHFLWPPPVILTTFLSHLTGSCVVECCMLELRNCLSVYHLYHLVLEYAHLLEVYFTTYGVFQHHCSVSFTENIEHIILERTEDCFYRPKELCRKCKN